MICGCDMLPAIAQHMDIVVDMLACLCSSVELNNICCQNICIKFHTPDRVLHWNNIASVGYWNYFWTSKHHMTRDGHVITVNVRTPLLAGDN